MKHCFKSKDEPEGLTDFRKARPKGTWEEFRNECQTGHRELVDLIYTNQKGLCAYCEIDLESPLDQMVEHFHPKNDSSSLKNWNLEWTNLILCCQGGRAPDTERMRKDGRVALEPTAMNLHCDIKGKSIVDEQIINPLEMAKFPCIWRIVLDGELEVDEASCHDVGIDPDKAKDTIKVFNLNSPTLKVSRNVAYNQIRKKISEGRKARKGGGMRRQTMEYLVARYIATQANGTKSRFFSCARIVLGKFAEQYLKASDDF